jgi:hypothetical protein
VDVLTSDCASSTDRSSFDAAIAAFTTGRVVARSAYVCVRKTVWSRSVEPPLWSAAVTLRSAPAS